MRTLASCSDRLTVFTKNLPMLQWVQARAPFAFSQVELVTLDAINQRELFSHDGVLIF